MNETQIIELHVVEKMWGPDDEYLVVPIGDIQVFEFDKGTKVKVTIQIRALP